MRSAALIRERIAPRQPRMAVLLGSGWGAVADTLTDAADIGYAELPAFPRLSIGGHAGLLRVGLLQGVPVLLLAGRKHAYENGDAAAMKGVIRTLAALQIELLVQSNAAGSLRSDMPPGSLMLLSDHLNLVQTSPLFGETGDSRFVGLSDAYDAPLREAARRAARDAGLALHEGVYAWLMGPQFETPAEIRMLQLLGAQAVGMSTVPETILARHAGLRVLALSMITNLAAGLSDEALSHQHTLQSAREASEAAVRMMTVLLPALAAGLVAPLAVEETAGTADGRQPGAV
ncbi:MAG: purine-nucleoside phosphorylase [Rubrivivax sp.]|nr:purine-nucleoside phosphorylase [Rubrivivax sp.]